MRALYPGSFDPPHLGHLDIIGRAAALCDGLLVAVAINPAKTPWLPPAERVRLLSELCRAWPSVRVVSYDDATAAAARRLGAEALVRGLRGPADLASELAMAAMHRRFGLETLLLPADPALAWISSRLVRDMHAAGLALDEVVPSPVAATLVGGSGACSRPPCSLQASDRLHLAPEDECTREERR